MDIDWTGELLEQLQGHWERQLRPRLDGLTDDEYLWEPVPGCWSIRPRGQGVAAIAAGSGAFTMDYALPPRDAEPVTTIAWRLAHIIVSIFGRRNASHFGGQPVDYQTFEYAGSAAAALRQLDDGYAAWVKGVRSLDTDALARPCGPAEAPFGDASMAGLVLHINREVIHHGAEVSLLRDLWAQKGTANGL